MTIVETIHTGKLSHDAMESRGQLPEVHRDRESITRRGIKNTGQDKRPKENAPGVTHNNRP